MQRVRYPERRRTVRLPLQIPVKVRCRLPEGETIDLQASTYVVSAHGALLLMDTPLIPGQSIRIFNEMTAESAECHVTSLREKRERRFVGVTFASPNTDFWHIVFPKSGTRQAVRSPQTGASSPPASARTTTTSSEGFNSRQVSRSFVHGCCCKHVCKRSPLRSLRDWHASVLKETFHVLGPRSQRIKKRRQ